MAPMWKKLMELVDLDEPTSTLDHVHLGCTKHECNPNEIIVEQYREMFESRICAGALVKQPRSVNITHRRLRSLTTWKATLKKELKDIANWRTKRQSICSKVQALYAVSSPCSDDHHFQKEELGSVGDLSKVCSQSVLKCLYVARIGRLDILFSVNELARITHQVDKSLWQTFSSFDTLCSSHE